MDHVWPMPNSAVYMSNSAWTIFQCPIRHGPYLANAQFGSLCVQFCPMPDSAWTILWPMPDSAVSVSDSALSMFGQCPIQQSLCPIRHVSHLANAQFGMFHILA